MVISRSLTLVGFILISLPLLGVETNSNLLKTPDKKEWPLAQKEAWKVSPSCLKGPCEALKPVSQKDIQKAKKVESIEHPAAQFCEAQKGKYLSGEYDSGDQDGICVFADGSYILGWDYYSKNLPKGKK